MLFIKDLIQNLLNQLVCCADTSYLFVAKIVGTLDQNIFKKKFQNPERHFDILKAVFRGP